jgi:hypothetical protein
MNWFTEHKKVLIVSALGVIIAGSLFFYAIHTVNATKQLTPLPATPKAEVLADLNNAGENSKPTEAASPTQQENTPTANPDRESISVSEISEIAHQYLHPGWLHFIKENASDTDRGNKGILEDGNVLSANSIWECWLNLDEMLLIQDSVCIQTNPDGSIIQVGVRSGNVGWNSSTDEVVVHNEDVTAPYIPDIDALASQAAKSNASLAVEEVTDEQGKMYYQLSYAVAESSPIPLWDYDNPVTAFDYVYRFDPETGVMLYFQQVVTFEDGSQRVIEQTMHQVFEIVDEAPDEIHQYLSKVQNQNN